MANESINLNLIPKGEMPVIHVSQFDNGRQFNINLLKGSDEYTLPAGYTAALNCRKADRNIVTLAATTVSSNTLTFTTTTQLCACAGNNLCEVVIKDAEDYQVGTLNFILAVEKDPLQGGIDSTSEIHDLTGQIEDITTEIVGENYYNKTETDTLLDAKADTSSLATVATSGSYNDLNNVPKINGITITGNKTAQWYGLASKLNDLSDVTLSLELSEFDTLIYNSSINKWINSKMSYQWLTDQPSIPAAQVQSDYAQSDNTKVDYIKNKPDLSVYAKESDLILATGTENEAPYQIRTAPSNIGDLAMEKLVGVSCVFNQLVNTGDTSINTISGHKYYTSINGTKSIISGGSAISINDSSEDNVIDLTAMFGSEVADYLYTLESGTAGAGVSAFKSLFGEEYYPYTANTLMSCKPLAKVIKDSNDQTVAIVNFSGTELRGLLKVGTNGLYADGDTDDGSGSTQVRYGIVDLGSLKYTYDDGIFKNYKAAGIDIGAKSRGIDFVGSPYSNSGTSKSIDMPDKSLQIFGAINNANLWIKDSGYNDATALKTALNGVYIVYELATPTTAVSTAWSNPIKAAAGGTEEFTDSRTIKMPTGHDTIYSKKPNYRYWG